MKSKFSHKAFSFIAINFIKNIDLLDSIYSRYYCY